MLFRHQFIKIKVFTAVMLISSGLTMPVAQANLLLDVDLSVENTITINALNGSALISETNGLFTGLYLDGFFGDSFTSSINDSLISSSITSANDTSGLFNDLFHFSNDAGLNLFSFDGGTASFIADELAFVGTGTWTVSETAYQSALNGAQNGNLFFPADSIDDIAGLSALGSWAISSSVEVAAPSTVLLFILSLASVLFSRKSVGSHTKQLSGHTG